MERPVTKDSLQRAAEAGFADEVRLTIKLAETPLTAVEGGTIVNTAFDIQATNLEREVAILQELAGLSDDPEWEATFGLRAEELSSRAQAMRESIATSQQGIEGLRGTNIPYYLTFSSDR